MFGEVIPVAFLLKLSFNKISQMYFNGREAVPTAEYNKEVSHPASALQIYTIGDTGIIL